MDSMLSFPSIKHIQSGNIELKHAFHDFVSFFAEEEGTVLLQSGGKQSDSRYNILAAAPRLIITAEGGTIKLKEKREESTVTMDPFLFLKKFVSFYSQQCSSHSDFPFLPGVFGYLSYDLKNYIERIPNETMDDLCLPELYLVLPELVVIQDIKSGEAEAVLLSYDGSDEQGISGLKADLEEAAGSKYSVQDNPFYAGVMESDFTEDEYTKIIAGIIEYIKAGDIYQVNMSQRFSAPFAGSVYSLYYELFEENPASFFSYLNCGDHFIVSTSPERFIKQEGSRIEARPIKGTRPRGKTPKEDRRLKEELLESAKDEAELSMIVDLLRNDIGKVSDAGSVRVTAHKTLESYRNVHHLVSYVEGTLSRDKDSIDLLKAAFPGGSITGCPKIRSMEIIEELEPVKRHIYTGSIGYIGFNGNMDLSIAIRTAAISDGRIYFSAGGGIVYDSHPEEEYFETLHKAESFRKILSLHESDSLRLENKFVWQNGKFILENAAAIPVSSHMVQYGRSVFETILVQHGKVRNLGKHIERLKRSCSVVLNVQLRRISFEKIIRDLLMKNRLETADARVKIIAAESSGFISLTVTAAVYIHRLKKTGRKGFLLGVFPLPRGNFLFNHKTGNYLYNLLAGEWAARNGFDEAVILNRDGSVSETNTGNILIMKGHEIIRPVSDYVLPGIKEQEILEEYKRKGFRIVEKAVYPEELVQGAVYVTNSLIGLVPVLSVSLKGEVS